MYWSNVGVELCKLYTAYMAVDVCKFDWSVCERTRV
jgi:hypothetical protein